MEKLKQITCCGENPTIENDVVKDGVTGYGILCIKKCHGTFHTDKDVAINGFLEHENAVDNRSKIAGENNLPTYKKPEYKPKKETKKPMNNNLPAIRPENMATVFESRKKEIALITSPILSDDKTAMERLMNNNTVRYPLTLSGSSWDKIWQSPEGQQSIIKGIEDALIMAAELGKMGDLVPYGKTCQFIPSVEAFEFALTNGNNAPFESLTIECIYKDDEYKSGRKAGNFFLDFESFGKKRTVVILVAVYGELKKSGIVVGEMYDAERLLEKAAIHSKPYANYIKMMKAYEYQKSEGKVSIDANGRESFPYHETAKSDDKYFEKSVSYFKQCEANGQLKTDSKGEYASQQLPKKNSSETWEKKIYRYEIEGGTSVSMIFLDSLENPYAGADQPEMLRKAAGKSFLGKYAKVRNSEAAMHEVRSSKGAMKESGELAKRQFIYEENVVEVEVSE